MDKSDLLQIKQQGVGTPSSGFVKGEYGPFECGHCSYFDPGKEACNQPRVGQDTQVTDRLKDGRPHVEAEDCCNFYWPKGLDPAKYVREQKLDTKSPHGFPMVNMAVVAKHIGGKKK
jgi:hypothetical protein